MTSKKTAICLFALCSVCNSLMAQSTTNSPYSRFGLGELNDGSMGFNKAMAGLHQGFRDGTRINRMNPASYSAVDSLTFLLDVGLTLQSTHLSMGEEKVTANNASFDYICGAFRIAPKTGISFGIVPYTSVGYSYSSKQDLVADHWSEEAQYNLNTCSGDGGLHKAYIGIGTSPFRNFSIGANFSYLWGDINHSFVPVAYSDGSVNSDFLNSSRYYESSIRSYSLDFGVQYELKFKKNRSLTIGATYDMGHKLHGDATLRTSGSSTDTVTVKNAYETPNTFGVGLRYKNGNKWSVGADYTLQKWGSCSMPWLNSNQEYVVTEGLMKDRHTVTLGGEYTPDAFGRSFFKRSTYKLGVSYSTPYIITNGTDGPKEYAATCGFTTPIKSSWNGRNILLNVAFQWVKASPTDKLSQISENYFRLSVGITFNERWFEKWKVQ